MKITIIGAGKVGSHLAVKLFQLGHPIVQVFSRERKHAATVALAVNAAPATALDAITTAADLYLLAVPDDAIPTVASHFAAKTFQPKLVAHTSGATPLEVLCQQGISRCGVFYPLQSFSPAREPDFAGIPFCIDAAWPTDLELLKNLAAGLSTKVYAVNDHQRAVLHVAAVFANNFTNHLFHIAHQLLEKENLPFDLLLPLIRETAHKLSAGPPAAMQTGPAIRGDTATLDRHLDYLQNFPAYREIYQLLTLSIKESREP